MTFLSYLLSKTDLLLYFTACIVLLYWIIGSKKSKGKMPPGPKPLPFIGNLNVLDLKKPNESLMELSEKYGEVFTIHIGPKKIVVIAGYSAVKDALVNQAGDFGERAHMPMFKLTNKDKGIALSNGEAWKAIRRYTVSMLREFGMMFHIFPRISTLLGEYREIVQNFNDVSEFVLKRIKHQRQELNSNVISGFIDAYLVKQEQELAKAGTFFDDENLVTTALDLFVAGTNTTSVTLHWGILLMMKYPEIQKKVQEEIQTHIKHGQMPTVDDRRNMPYTEAVIHEIQRFANVFPFNIPHTTPHDVFFRGYCIPKGTDVIPFLTSVLYDKTQWETPYLFNPNHFLNEAGKFIKRDAFMPFSAGRRVCVGEGLAKMELFLFFTGFLQTFTFNPPPGVSREDINLSSDTALVSVPLPYLVCAKLNDWSESTNQKQQEEVLSTDKNG